MKNATFLPSIRRNRATLSHPRLTGFLKHRTAPALLVLFACLSAGAQTHQWTWMAGSNVVGSAGGQPGVYGVQGKFAPANIPGSRSGAATWTDSAGNLWLFGGFGFDVTGAAGNLNDLWEFNPLLDQWAWIGGLRTCGLDGGYTACPGNYGTVGAANSSNAPGGRQNASSWTDASGRLWLFGGNGEDGNDAFGYLNDLWQFDPSTAEWTWFGGSDTAGHAGVYGVLGTPGAESAPGSRAGATSWADVSGRLWLFGGYGYAAVGDLSYLNDLWQFDPSTNQWTWVSGSSVLPCPSCAQPGVYGNLGSPAPANVPGGRNGASGWTDTSGHLWLFAGFGDDAAGHDGYLNDLWEFNPSANEWMWVSGSNSVEQPGVYGTLATPAPGNLPGSRESASGWVDSSGHFWLLGGSGYDAHDFFSDLNDLWEFNPSTNQWTWMGGASMVSRTAGPPGVYGTLGTPAAANLPGGRYSAATWTDANGHFWLFGGTGYDSKDANGALNDFWRYEPVAQTPTTTTIASSPNPSGFGQQVTFTATVTSSDGAPPDGETVQFLMGTTLLGAGTLFNGDAFFSSAALAVGKSSITAVYVGDRNFAGSSSAALTQTVNKASSTTTLTSSTNPTSYQALATFTVQVTPQFAQSAPATGTVTFKNGSVTLGAALLNSTGAATFHYSALPLGDSSITAVYSGDTNYATSTSTVLKQVVTAEVTGDWTWWSGGDSYQPGTYGTLGVPALANVPGGRGSSATWTDLSGHLWLFGGNGYGTSTDGGNGGYLNDLWQFNPATDEWVWMGGSGTSNQFGVYGTLGKAAAANLPGSRSAASSWTDTSGNFWLFGGSGYASAGNPLPLNDLWEFSPTTMEWTWVSGSSTLPANGAGRPGVYGTLGTPAPANVPGGRSGAVTVIDSSGHLWLFGGLGYDVNDDFGFLNDLWEFTPSTREWTWISGSSSGNQNGVYGTLGTAAAGNVPSSRGSGSLWIDSGGHLWLFGGNSNNGWMNDLWEFNPSNKEWTWVSGSSLGDQSSVFGTLGTPAAGNVPGGRYGASNWKDSAGHFWLFGGQAVDNRGQMGLIGDLWEFNPSTKEWELAAGYVSVLCASYYSQCYDPGSYAVFGTPSVDNQPPGRYLSMSWTGGSGQLWLFGGYSAGYMNPSGYINDLWQFQLPATPPAVPTFSAPAGIYTGPLTVSIRETTPGATIHYTTNGTAPTANSAIYAGPIEVSHAATVKAIAIAPGRPASALAVATYTILKAQTIAFAQLATLLTYGAKPIALKAKASSGLPVTFSLISGPAKLTGSTLTITGAGAVVIAARQPGDATYAPAKPVKLTLTVEKAELTVAARNLTMKAGASVPALACAITGFVDGDTLPKATTGKPALSTTATAKSPSGTYAITIKGGTLAAPNYNFTFAGGKLTVTE